MPTVTGGVVLRPALGAFHNAVLHIHLQDVTFADAPARRLKDLRITGVTYDASGEEVVWFTLAAPAWESSRTVLLSAHLDRSGNGRVEPGDAVTTESYPVPPPVDDPWLLRLTRVGG
jgi:putative lipoprotein